MDKKNLIIVVLAGMLLLVGGVALGMAFGDGNGTGISEVEEQNAGLNKENVSAELKEPVKAEATKELQQKSESTAVTPKSSESIVPSDGVYGYDAYDLNGYSPDYSYDYGAYDPNAYTGGSGDNFWSSGNYSGGNYYDNNNSGYVNVPGYGAVGYGELSGGY